MISTVADLLPRLLPEVPGCPENYASLVLRDAVREVCRISQIWTKELAAINLVATTASYALDPDVTAGTEPEVLRIISAKRSGIEIPTAQYRLVRSASAPYFSF